jgi:NADH dehydrogenase
MVETQKVLIVGGGFGGVRAALSLVDDARFSVTLLSDDTELRYYPTLYRTATGGKRANSSIPLKRIFINKNINLVEGVAVSVDRRNKAIITKSGHSHPYDVLILALGVVTNYFGVDGLNKFSYSIKSQAEVTRFKAHLHQQIVEDRRPDLNYVIVGAGPTGIELAAVLPQYIRRIMKNHTLKQRSVHVDIIEALPRLLPRMPIDTSRAVLRQLKHLGIRIFLNSKVQAESADVLIVNGKPIRSHTVVWTAGVSNHPFFATNNFTISAHHKVSTDMYLEAEKDIFVIGDNADTPYSGMAQTALHDGRYVAVNLIRRANGQEMLSYIAKKPTVIITAGNKWAAVVWGKLRIYGWLGWLLREAADIIGFHDIEPWNVAAKQWLTEFGPQEDCIVCSIADSSK